MFLSQNSTSLHLPKHSRESTLQPSKSSWDGSSHCKRDHYLWEWQSVPQGMLSKPQCPVCRGREDLEPLALGQKARTGLSWVCEPCLAQAVPGTGLRRGQTHLGPPLGWQEFPRSEEGVGSQASWLVHSKTEALPKYRSFSSAAVLWVTLWDWRWVQDYRQCFTLLLQGSLELTWKGASICYARFSLG